MLPDGTLPDDYVVLDLETTGVSWYRDTIIEFGAVKVIDRKPVDTYQQLVNPMRNLNPFITQLTGITPDMLEPAPTLDTVLPDFLRWCGDDAMIGHNIMQFDIKFIDLAAQRILHHAVPNRIIDTLQMSRSMYPQYNRHRLVDLIQRFDIADVEEHRALSDADLKRLLESVRKPIDATVAAMPSQEQFIDSYCKAPPSAWEQMYARARQAGLPGPAPEA